MSDDYLNIKSISYQFFKPKPIQPIIELFQMNFSPSAQYFLGIQNSLNEVPPEQAATSVWNKDLLPNHEVSLWNSGTSTYFIISNLNLNLDQSFNEYCNYLFYNLTQASQFSTAILSYLSMNATKDIDWLQAPRKSDQSFVPFSSESIISMNHAFSGTNCRGPAACGNNVVNMQYAQHNCTNLTGAPVCGPSVRDMAHAQEWCQNLTGSPVCGPNVINMASAQQSCRNLTGSPICGNNVKNMSGTQSGCISLTGAPVCGDNVVNMQYAQYNCTSLTGAPVCGLNVTELQWAQVNCPNLSGNMQIAQHNVNMYNCFFHHNNAYRLNIHVVAGSNTNAKIANGSVDGQLFGLKLNWIFDYENTCQYNLDYNCQIYYNYIPNYQYVEKKI